MTRPPERHDGVDLLRGIVMLLMVIDHARDYQSTAGGPSDPMDLATVTPLLFIMRWLAHFCAPVFTLLMGVSVSFSADTRPQPQLSRQIFLRGCLLLLLEFTVVDWSWTFNPLWPRKFFQIIGALGVAHLVLATVLPLGRGWAMATAVSVLALHNLADGLRFPEGTPAHYLWSFLHQKNVLPLFAGFEVRTTYPVLPVIAVALLGFGLGPLVRKGGTRLGALGTALILGFLVLRLAADYGDPHSFELRPSALYTVFSLLNVTKYPFSLQFVCMTLGPALIFLAWRRTIDFRRLRFISTLGRVPMFFYIGHLYALHLLALAWALALGFPVTAMSLSARFGGRPQGFGFPLWQTIPFAALATLLIYRACRRYDQLRRSRRYPLLAYF